MAAFLRKSKFPISNDDIFEVKNLTSKRVESEGRARAVAYKNYKI